MVFLISLTSINKKAIQIVWLSFIAVGLIFKSNPQAQ